MLFDKDVNPQYDVYFLGGRLIDILVTENINSMGFGDFFQAVNDKYKISISLFILTMDWLFLLGLVKFNQEGELERCF